MSKNKENRDAYVGLKCIKHNLQYDPAAEFGI